MRESKPGQFRIFTRIMQSADSLMAWFYPLIKRNQWLRRALLPVWRFVMELVAWGRSLRGQEGLAAPTRHAAFRVWADAADAPEAVCTDVYPPHTIRRTLPRVPGEVHWCFKKQEQRQVGPMSVAVVPGGRVLATGQRFWDESVAVMAPDGTVLSDFSYEIEGVGYRAETGQHYVFNMQKLPPVRRIKGTVALLTAPVGSGYYHWMLQVLPRIHLLQQAGIRLEQVNAFLVNSHIAPFQKETLAALGIPASKVVQSQWYPHVQADRLIVASLPVEPLAWACDFLRDTFLNEAVRDEASSRIYISRAAANHRRVANEAELRALLEKYGFTTVFAEDLSVAEMAARMASAEAVVGPHGAGLSNLVFCNPGTKVIELFASRGVHPLFWGIANHVSLGYYYLRSEGADRPKERLRYPHLDQDIVISPDALLKRLRFAGLYGR